MGCQTAEGVERTEEEEAVVLPPASSKRICKNTIRFRA